MIINIKRDGSVFDPEKEEVDGSVLEVLNEIYRKTDHSDVCDSCVHHRMYA